jgi:serine/threonine protein kinase
MGCIGSKAPTLESLYDVDPKVIGSGQYATVVKAKNRKTGLPTAIKKIVKKHSKRENLDAEIAILRKFGDHKNIVCLYDVFETDAEIQLAMEFMSGGELFDSLCNNGPYDEDLASKHVRAIASALLYLHSEGVAHRDLKPENLLLSSMGENALLKVLPLPPQSPPSPTHAHHTTHHCNYLYEHPPPG